jgi:aminodeoxyfutalosine deaminase
MVEPSAFVRALPKVQLHCHLEGTVRAATFRELAAHHGVESARATGPLEATYAFEAFGDFLLTFAEVCKALQHPDDYARIARDYAVDATADRVRYAEIFISPSVWTFFHKDLDVVAVVEAMRAAFDAERVRGGPDVRLICDLTRNFGVERARKTAERAVDLAGRGLGVVGIGLGGDEANYPPAQFAAVYDYARAHGLHTVAHAGEAAGPQSVRDAIDILHAERIGHGVRALEDPHLVAELAERRIALELCPTSNRLTGAVAPGAPHPIGTFDAAGVICTIDADDPALFSTTLNHEYALVEALLGEAALVRFARNAIDASFAEPERKAALRAALDAFSLEMTAPRRTP